MSGSEGVISTLRDLYSKSEKRTVGFPGIGLSKLLIRVGLSIVFSAIALFTIILILFAPTFRSLPIGRSGQVLLGVVGSAVAFKLYRLFKLSNSTIISSRPEDLLFRTEMTPSSRFLHILFSVVFTVAVPISGLYIWYKLEDLARTIQIPSTIEFFLLVFLLLTEVGFVVIFVGCFLVLEASTRPLRVLMFTLYRKAKYHALERLSRFKFMKSLYDGPDLVCESCYNTTFEIHRPRPDFDHDYRIECSKCTEPYGGATIEKISEIESRRGALSKIEHYYEKL